MSEQKQQQDDHKTMIIDKSSKLTAPSDGDQNIDSVDGALKSELAIFDETATKESLTKSSPLTAKIPNYDDSSVIFEATNDVVAEATDAANTTKSSSSSSFINNNNSNCNLSLSSTLFLKNLAEKEETNKSDNINYSESSSMDMTLDHPTDVDGSSGENNENDNDHLQQQIKQCSKMKTNIEENPAILMGENGGEKIPQSQAKYSNETDPNSNSTQESNLEDIDIPTSTIANVAETAEASLNSSSSNNSNNNDNSNSQEYHLKWIKWKGCNTATTTASTTTTSNNNNSANVNDNKVPIVTQNSNGSCPLLAIINVLLLRKNISFPPIIEIVTASQLMDYLCDCILNFGPKNLPEQEKLNYEQNLQDAMSIMPRLLTGLDVNVKFTGPMDFEYTPECIIFDLLNIPLYHGWLVDPNQKEIYRIVNNQSYNQLVDRIIASKASNSSDTEMFLAEEFLKQTASQLTNYGLQQLIKHIKEEELCILFRNNHFITLFKHKGKLFQLVTDQGFLTEPNVVWESLDNIEGDTYFVDGDFNLVPPKPSLQLQPNTLNINTQQQIDHDYLIALSLDQEQSYEMERSKTESKPDTTAALIPYVVNQQEQPKKVDHENIESLCARTFISDEELARKLQAEEDQKYQEPSQRQQQPKFVPKQYPSSMQAETAMQQPNQFPSTKQGNCLNNVRWPATQQQHPSRSLQKPTSPSSTTTAQQPQCYSHHSNTTTRSSSSTTLTQHQQQQQHQPTGGHRSASSHPHHHHPHLSRSSTTGSEQSNVTTTASSGTASSAHNDNDRDATRRSNAKNCTIS